VANPTISSVLIDFVFDLHRHSFMLRPASLLRHHAKAQLDRRCRYLRYTPPPAPLVARRAAAAFLPAPVDPP
jgi:hypothetical protein